MPTVIDSLVVELLLDDSKYKKGLADALAQTGKGKDVIVRHAKEVEGVTKTMTHGFSGLRTHLLGVAALFTGGLGLKAFIADATATEMGVGRLSKVLGTSTETLSNFRGAGLLAGGSADSFSNVLKTITLELAKLQLTGESAIIPMFRSLGVAVQDGNGKFKNATQLFLEVADAIDERKIDPARATVVLQSMGADDVTVSAILKGRAALQGYLDQAKRTGEITKTDTEAASALSNAWTEMTLSSSALGRTILTGLSPALVTILGLITRLTQTKPTAPTGSFEGVEYDALGLPVRKGGAPAKGSGTSPASLLRLKPGAGLASPGISALAASLQSDIPGLNRFTAFNDSFHAGSKSKHAEGLALDFTLKDVTKSADVAEKIRGKLKDMKVDAKVIDEYLNPSAGSTNGHIHVQFGSADAAARFSAAAGITGAGGVAAASVDNSQSRSSSVKNDTKIGTIVVQTQATDAAGIARDISKSVENSSFGVNANYGQE